MLLTVRNLFTKTGCDFKKILFYLIKTGLFEENWLSLEKTWNSINPIHLTIGKAKVRRNSHISFSLVQL